MAILDELKLKASGKADSANNIQEAISMMDLGGTGTLAENVKVFYLEGYYDEGVWKLRILDDSNELSTCVRNGVPTILCFAGDGNQSEYYLYAGSYFSQVYYHVWATAPMRASHYTNFSKLEIKFLTSYDFKNVSKTTVNVDATIV